MTLFLADIAAYQKTLTVLQLRAAGFGGINVKVSHGLTQKSVHPNVQTYVREAREISMALSCFHWLDGSASGVAQADYAYRQMALLGLNVPGVAHVCDCESDATQGIYEDYVARMTQLLQRPIVTYSGDWWIVQHPCLRPGWLWAAPAPGYQPAYPGDDSPLWDALVVMQYRVSPINGIKVSQSAVRDLALWGEMIGLASKTAGMLNFERQLSKAFPNRALPDGWIADEFHTGTSSHHPDDTPGSKPEWDGDPDSVQDVRAVDVKKSLGSPVTLRRVFEHMAKLPNLRSVVRYMIHQGKIWHERNDFIPVDHDGDSHPNHGHVTFAFTEAADDNTTFNYRFEELVDMPLTDAEYDRIADEVVAKFWTTPYGSESYPTRTPRNFARDLHAERDYAVGDGKGAAYANVKAGSFLDIVGKMAQQNPGVIETDPEAIALAILPALSAAIIAELPEGTLTEEQVQAASERAVRNVLRSGVDE